MPEDPPAAHLMSIQDQLHGLHFLTSDEAHLDAFEPTLRGVGGVYVGVGAEQAYLLVAWARAEGALLLDYDPRVVAMHGLHRVFLLESETPEAYLSHWTEEGAEAARALLRGASPDARSARLAVGLYDRARRRVRHRYERLGRDLTAPWFLTDRAQYAHLRGLLRAGRVRALCADLRAPEGAIGALGEALRRGGLRVGALYLSNAEQYWRYDPPFRRNIRGLPSDRRSVVLRTLAARPDYRYHTQPLGDFQDALGRATVRDVYQVAPR